MAQLYTEIKGHSGYSLNNEVFRWVLTALIKSGLLWVTIQAMGAGIITEKPGSRNEITGIPALELHPERIFGSQNK